MRRFTDLSVAGKTVPEIRNRMVNSGMPNDQISAYLDTDSTRQFYHDTQGDEAPE